MLSERVQREALEERRSLYIVQGLALLIMWILLTQVLNVVTFLADGAELHCSRRGCFKVALDQNRTCPLRRPLRTMGVFGSSDSPCLEEPLLQFFTSHLTLSAVD